MELKKYLPVLFMAVTINSNMAQSVDCYKEVDRIVWIVADLQEVIRGWQALGFTDISDYGAATLLIRNAGEIDVNIASANFGGARITWIQPVSKDNPFSTFLDAGGDGAFGLMHRVSSVDALQQESLRLKRAGVGILLEGNISTEEGLVNFVFFDTQKDGKYALGLITGPDDMKQLSGQNQLGMKFAQFAFAIQDPEPVSAYWAGLDFPPFEITHGETWGKQYYGNPAEFDMELGWQRHGNIVYEWCIPLKGPTVYEDHIKLHGEGIQHLGFNVADMDQTIRFFEDRGFDISMSGGWGDKGKPGSGRFAYVNTEKIGGETIELLWSYKN